MISTSTQRLPSDRRFGWTFAAAFAVLGLYAIARHRSWIVCGLWFLGSIGFGALTCVAPRALTPLKRAWLRLGEWLGRIVSPIVLGVIFFGILTPVALLGRLLGRDELQLKRRATGSYWLPRTGHDAAASSFRNQF
jgi:hypothetical protein